MKNYIRQSFIYLLLLAAITIFFNTWADPYNIYRFKSADSERMSRINPTYSMRLAKPWQVFQARPQAAIIGSSRSGSIPPRQSRWPERRTFNLSMVGMTLYEMQQTIAHAH